MFKEALEDIQRFQADREVNKRGVLIYNAHSSAWVRKQWRDILVSPRSHTLPCACLRCCLCTV